MHATIVRHAAAAARWREDNADVLAAVQRRLAAGDTTAAAKAYGDTRAAPPRIALG